ncbi:hypothetical protein KKG19_05440 [Patescibacteria group bacterium]|nr:hypothetical protein [Patescibacteria group bacterium]
MAESSFTPHSFLIKLSPDLLTQYAKKQNIPFETKIEEAGEELMEEFLKTLEKEPEEKQDMFWLDSIDIDEIGTGNGCDYLLSRILEHGYDFDKKAYQELKNAKERALYLYLNFGELFTEICDEYGIENMQGWRGEKTVSKPYEDIVVNIFDLEQGLKTIFKKEFKGNNLKVKHIRKKERVIFIGFVEDSLTNDTAFKKGTLKNRMPRKPVFHVYYIYNTEQGILDVKAKGGKRKIKQLKEAFIECLLKEEANVIDDVRYNFETIKDIEDLKFPVERTDLIQSVTLKGLRLIHNSTKTRVAIDVGNTSATGTEAMIESLKRMEIDLMDYRVTQFKLEIIFDNLGKGRTPKVSVTLSYPNICNLKDREIDIEVRRLLKKWNLDLF